MELTFSVQYETKPNQRIFICGSIASIGNWNVNRAIEMHWSTNHLWKCTIRLQDVSLLFLEEKKHDSVFSNFENWLGIEYKYIVREEQNGAISWKWEEGANHKVSISLRNLVSSIQIDDVWMQPILSLPTLICIPDSEKITVCFFVNTEGTGHSVYLATSIDNWKSLSPLTKFNPVQSQSSIWFSKFHLARENFPFEYKYILKSNFNSGIFWEKGQNRSVSLGNNKGASYIFEFDGIFRTPSSENSQVSESWLRTGMCGISNTFACCSINTVVQMLFYLPKFKEVVSSSFESQCKGILSPSGTESSSLCTKLKEVFLKLQEETTLASTRPIIEACGLPEDVHEFIRLICFTIHTELTSIGNNEESIISNLFRGKFVYTTNCKNVQFSSQREEEFFDISVRMGTEDLHFAIEQFLSPTEIFDYKHEVFGAQEASLQASILQLPPVLVIHLSRFYYNTTENIIMKDRRRMHYPEKLDMSKYAFGREENVTYRLMSVLVHKGDSRCDSGHYFCYVQIQNDWYFDSLCSIILRFKFDDENVYKVGNSFEVFEKNFGGEENDSSESQHAYVLIYISEQLQNEKVGKQEEKFGV